MSAPAPVLDPPRPVLRVPGLPLALGFVGLALAAAALAGAVPLAFSIATVFLFAGPHNWLEARYVLGRLPARVGKLRGFFLLSAAGIVGLTIGYAALPWLVDAVPDPSWVGPLYATWNTAFLFWIATLVWMRSRTNPRFDGGWVWPAALLIASGVWLSPIALNVTLVYLHPLLALVLLDRELKRSRPGWRKSYHTALLAVPVLLGVLWWHLHDAPDLEGTDPFTAGLTAAITNHAGAWYLEGISTHFLVAAHTFLEMVHYGVWVCLIPLVGLRSWPWKLSTIPAARRDASWSRGVAAVLFFGLFVVLVLWACFLLDYGTTRSVYFTVAMLHVLAEIPFLLRMV
ncbi:MAG TPA: hypothetical protein VKE74_21240 [Gemmataceae bacterium]|nr:hypothetical protein [Gemmataceae bacterium]